MNYHSMVYPLAIGDLVDSLDKGVSDTFLRGGT